MRNFIVILILLLVCLCCCEGGGDVYYSPSLSFNLLNVILVPIIIILSICWLLNEIHDYNIKKRRQNTSIDVTQILTTNKQQSHGRVTENQLFSQDGSPSSQEKGI